MDRLVSMEIFVRVVEAGSLSGAARQLGTSLAAVSRHLAALEQDLGVPLARRTTRRLEVTPAGRRYYEHALHVVRAVDEARQSVLSGSGLDGLLRVSVSVTVGRHRILPALPAWLAKNPELELDLFFDDRSVELVDEGIDIAIRTVLALPDSPSLVMRALGSCPLVLCASPAYVARWGEPRTPSELQPHRLIGHPSHERGRRWWLRRGDENVDVSFPCRIRTDDAIAAQALVREGLGFAALPAWQVARDVEEKHLRVLLPDWTLPELRILALFRRQPRGASAVRAFVDHLAEVFAATSAAPFAASAVV
jgi:DNA-binding transcriptional LysR family regulator